jgi:glycosyltransferase involved in cell wall biosynthesis
MKNLKITIGIPAYNEEVNVVNLLEDLIKQEISSFKLEKIIIASDGGSDTTVSSVKRIDDKRIQIIKGRNRIGKPARINQIIQQTNSDILVLLDADIRLKSNLFLINLIKPFIKQKDVALVSGYAIPYKPKNMVENIAYAGIKIWDEARKSLKNTDMYYCEGQVRALDRKLYTKIKFPNYSADDVYIYLCCVSLGYKFISAKRALVFYKLPSTVNDYRKQLKRYLQSKNIQEKSFRKEFVDSFYVITFRQKLLSFLKCFNKDPFWTSLYLSFVILPKFFALFTTDGSESKWEILQTTKHLKNDKK